MSLIKTETVKRFDSSSIQPGDLICARYEDWDEERTALVSEVSNDRLTALYVIGKMNSSNYFVMLASEVAAGKWQIRWSSDLLTISEWEGES